MPSFFNNIFSALWFFIVNFHTYRVINNKLTVNLLFTGSWGKRDPAWNNLKGYWGKRSNDQDLN